MYDNIPGLYYVWPVACLNYGLLFLAEAGQKGTFNLESISILTYFTAFFKYAYLHTWY